MNDVARPYCRWFPLVAACSLFAAHVAAQEYPIKPVRMLVGFVAGSGTDTAARLLVADKIASSRGPRERATRTISSAAKYYRNAVALLRQASALEKRQSSINVRPSLTTEWSFAPTFVEGQRHSH